MSSEKLIEQLELYANTIVGFIVAQSLAFSFTFGTNAAFGCEITRYKILAATLIAHFCVTTLVAWWGVEKLTERMCLLSKETELPLTELGLNTLRVAARAKGAVIALFTLIPIGLLLFFGLLGDPDAGRCSKAVSADATLSASSAV